MATNLIMKEGRCQEWAVAGKTAGSPVIKGTMTGVCLTDTDASGNVSVDLEGVYDLSVKGIDDAGNSAVAVGDKIFYVVGDSPLLSKKASGYFFGFALETVGSGLTATINVLQIPGPGPGTADIIAGSVNTAALADEAVTVGKMADLTRGSILTGQTASNRPAALAAKTSGQILVGDGTDLVSVAVSGDATLAANGALTIADEAVTVGKMADLARGSIITGQTAGNRPTALDAKTSGRILVGDGTDLASVAVSGDVSLAANGAVTIAAGAVESSMLANGAGLAAAIASGLGASAAYIKTTNGVQTLMAQDAAARVVLGIVVVDEVFADAGGNQPTFTIGETDSATKYQAAAVLTNAAAGTVFFFAGTLTATKALIVTAVQAVGAGTGGISVTALVLDAAP